MKIKPLISIFLLLLHSHLAYSQNSSSNIPEKNIGIKLSYFGEFVMHPGFVAGIDYSLITKKWFTLHWDSEIGAFFHRRNNNSLFVQSTIGSRLTSSFSLFFDVNAGLGYILSTPSGEIYSPDENGDVTTENRPYTSHLKPTVSFLVGWDGSHKRQIPIIIQIGLEAYWQTHFNQSLLPHAALRLGIVYKLKS